jgi:hypothetical protein
MLTLDQAKIGAPAFPRTQAWWDRFLPSFMTADVREDGTVVIDVTGQAHPSQGLRHPAEVRRNQELALLRWLHNLPQLEPAIIEQPGSRCQCWCWTQPARLHNGHCCFTRASICHAMPGHMRQAPAGTLPA